MTELDGRGLGNLVVTIVLCIKDSICGSGTECQYGVLRLEAVEIEILQCETTTVLYAAFRAVSDGGKVGLAVAAEHYFVVAEVEHTVECVVPTMDEVVEDCLFAVGDRVGGEVLEQVATVGDGGIRLGKSGKVVRSGSCCAAVVVLTVALGLDCEKIVHVFFTRQ